MNDTIEIVIILAVTFVAIPLLIVFVRNILRLCKKNEYEIDLHEIQLGKTPSTDRKTSRLKYNEYSYNISRIKVFTPIGLAMYMATSKFGHIWTIIHLFSCVLGVALSITEGYLGFTQPWIMVCEGILCIFFIIDYLIWFYCAEDRLEFFYSINSVVDLLSIVSVLSSFFMQNADRMNAVRVFRVLRIIRVLNTPDIFFLPTFDDIRKQILKIAFIMATFILFEACIIEQIEDLSFHDAVYFTIVTVGTVGYGDYTPKTTTGRIFVAIMILVALCLTAWYTSELISAMQARSPYTGKFIKRKQTHVVVLGQIKYSSLKAFLREFLHSDLYSQAKVVIMNKDKPSREIKSLLEIPYNQRKVTYLQGSEMVRSDLLRANIQSAQACFILSSKHSSNPQQADAEAVIRTIAVKSMSPNLNIFTQIIKTESKTHIHAQGIKHLTLDEMTTNILAQNCTSPGFATLITNLTRTCPIHKSDYVGWQKEFVAGSSQQIYGCTFPPWMNGICFMAAAQYIYQKTSMLLLGMQVSLKQRVMVCPMQQIISEEDVAFVITFSVFQASELEFLPITDDEMDQLHHLNRSLVERMTQFDIYASQTFSPRKKKVGEDIFRHWSEISGSSWNHLYNIGHQVLLKDVTHKSVKFTGHIIVTGSLAGLADFILTLRAKRLKQMTKIVILHPTPVDDDIWETVGVFPEVHYIQGSAPQDLARANAAHAKSIVFLASRSSDATGICFGDAQRIITTRVTEAQYKECYVVTELEDENAIKFLTVRKDFGTDDILENIVNTVICELKLIVKDEEESLLFEENQDPNKLPEYFFSEDFMSGKVFAPSMVDSLLCQYYYNPYLTWIVKALTQGDRPDCKVRAQVYQIDIPHKYKGCQWQELFAHLIDNLMLPLGLLRDRHPKPPYVYTNPKMSIILSPKDRVFILAQKEPVLHEDNDSHTTNEGKPKEVD